MVVVTLVDTDSDYDTALDDVQRFIIAIIDSLADKTFHPGPHLSTKLTNEYRKYKEASGDRRTEDGYLEYIQTLKDAPRQSWLDCGDNFGNGLGAIKYRINRAEIEQAYANHFNPAATSGDGGSPLLETRLLTLLCSLLLRAKIGRAI